MATPTRSRRCTANSTCVPISDHRPDRFVLLKGVVAGLALAPAARLGYGATTGYLGIDPVETLAIGTGQAAVTLLLLSLAITPFRKLTGWNAFIRLRRMLGLFAFFYAVLHVATYVVFDQEGSLRLIAADVLEHPWVLFGALAFLLLVPLAVTSTKGWIRRLGSRWQKLHRLVYVAAISAVLHFLLAVKLDIRKPLAYAGILLTLFGIRALLRRRGAPRRLASPGPAPSAARG